LAALVEDFEEGIDDVRELIGAARTNA